MTSEKFTEQTYRCIQKVYSWLVKAYINILKAGT